MKVRTMVMLLNFLARCQQKRLIKRIMTEEYEIVEQTLPFFKSGTREMIDQCIDEVTAEKQK